MMAIRRAYEIVAWLEPLESESGAVLAAAGSLAKQLGLSIAAASGDVLADEPQAFGSAVEASILRTAELSAAMCAFGQTLLTSGRHEDAALVAEILLESDGSSPVARALVRQAALAGAEERWLTGDPDGAVRKLQLLAERLPGDPQSAELLAEAPTTFAMKAVETAVLDGDEFGAHDLFRAAWERATGYPSAKARLKIGAAEFAEKMASTDGVSRLARQIGYFPVVLEAEDEAEFDTPERWERTAAAYLQISKLEPDPDLSAQHSSLGFRYRLMGVSRRIRAGDLSQAESDLFSIGAEVSTDDPRGLEHRWRELFEAQALALGNAGKWDKAVSELLAHADGHSWPFPPGDPDKVYFRQEVIDEVVVGAVEANIGSRRAKAFGRCRELFLKCHGSEDLRRRVCDDILGQAADSAIMAGDDERAEDLIRISSAFRPHDHDQLDLRRLLGWLKVIDFESNADRALELIGCIEVTSDGTSTDSNTLDQIRADLVAIRTASKDGTPTEGPSSHLKSVLKSMRSGWISSGLRVRPDAAVAAYEG
jgi:hypothetical protein